MNSWADLKVGDGGIAMSIRVEELLDRSTAAREVATIVALALMRAGGDPEAALAILDVIGANCPAIGDELDCSTIGQQAIRDAVGMQA
jgi:hypothetical protein